MTPDREHLELRVEASNVERIIAEADPRIVVRPALLAFLLAALSGAIVGGFIVWVVTR